MITKTGPNMFIYVLSFNGLYSGQLDCGILFLRYEVEKRYEIEKTLRAVS